MKNKGRLLAAAKDKVSKEIIILSIVVILYSLQGLPNLNFAAYAIKFQPISEKLIFGRYLLSLALRTILFTAGIGILFRKDIFRKSIIFISLFTICTIYWKHPLLCFKNSLMFDINHGVLSVSLLPKIDMIAWICVVICYMMDISIAVFLIYLFTRPKIKEQFK
jgi:hypothetical protein